MGVVSTTTSPIESLAYGTRVVCEVLISSTQTGIVANSEHEEAFMFSSVDRGGEFLIVCGTDGYQARHCRIHRDRFVRALAADEQFDNAASRKGAWARVMEMSA